MIEADIRGLPPQATVAVRLPQPIAELDLGQLFGHAMRDIGQVVP
jgi:hypothetical protein